MEMIKTSTKLSEAEQRRMVFSQDSMEVALSLDCGRSKESYPCPHGGKCKDIFTRSEGPAKIEHLRTLIWLRSPCGEQAPTTHIRRNNFVSLLKSMNRTTSNKIMFCMGGKYVCKSYFKVLGRSLL
jgi:hypothetical protein